MRGATRPCKKPLTSSSDFNPRFPCGERPHNKGRIDLLKEFQSTLPMRGATTKLTILNLNLINFNPRFPCGERRTNQGFEECTGDFNPRFPCGERPSVGSHIERLIRISIHASHAGSDLRPYQRDLVNNINFNPRFPCGERRT